MSSKLICRHCKEDHLSIQCPTKNKNKKNIILNTTKKDNNIKKERKNYNDKLLVKMYPLPLDLMKIELLDLLRPWGPIGKVYVKKDKYTDFQSATIEFLKKSQGKKAIYQLNETPFDFLRIKVEELTTKNYN